MSVSHVRLGIANDDDGEHIDVLRVEVGEGSGLHLLLVAPGLTDIAYGRRCRPPLQEQFLQPVELPVAPVRLGIVDGSHEVPFGGSTDAALDDLPRRHQVRERYDAQVVADGGSQERGGLLEGRDAGQHLDVDVGGGASAYRTGGTAIHLVDEWGHTVDAGIATGDDHDGLALPGQQESLLGTLALALHAGVNTRTSLLQIGGDKLEIVFIADDGISLAYCMEHSGSDVVRTAGTNAGDNDFSLHGSKSTK